MGRPGNGLRFQGVAVATPQDQNVVRRSREAHQTLGNVLIEICEVDEGIEHLDVVFANDKTEKAGVYQALSNLFALQGVEGRAVAHYLDAKKHRSDGSAALALGACQRALHEDPRFARAHFEMGTLFRSMGERDRAAESFRLTHDIRPETWTRAALLNVSD